MRLNVLMSCQKAIEGLHAGRFAEGFALSRPSIVVIVFAAAVTAVF